MVAADSGLFVIESVGDTVIQGVNCSILEHTEGEVDCTAYHEYVGVVGDSVVFWNMGAGDFRTLYSFGTAIDSSWSMEVNQPSPWSNGDTLIWTVSDTGHVIVDGLHLRTMEVARISTSEGETETFSSSTVFERLGDVEYMFQWFSGACDYEFIRPLRCYEDPDITWLNPQNTRCDLGVGIEERPSSSEFSVRSDLVAPNELFTVSGITGPVEIFDASGRSVLRRKVTASATLSLPECGSYVVRATSLYGEVSHTRIVVQ